MADKNYIFTADEFVDRLMKTKNMHNIYVSGGFGVSLKGKQLDRYTSNYEYNKKHAAEIRKEAENQPLFGFDCIGYIKGHLWGFTGNPDQIYGGAQYRSNGVDDYSVNGFFKHCCTQRQKIFDGMPKGYIVHAKQHIAVCIGGNLVLESTRYGGAKIRVARIKGLPVAQEAASLPEREFDECGECIFINYENHDREKGDVNGDGKIDAKDYMLCKRIVLGTYEPSEEEFWAADINDDGKVSALDYVRLKRMVLGK